MIRESKPPESAVEITKRNGRALRGRIAETLEGDATKFGKDDIQLLKFHGTYQHDDRDLRRDRRRRGLPEAIQFMVRCAIPAGVLTADQYLQLDALSDQHANKTLRITTRQGIQFHGVVKENLKATIAAINRSLVTTLSACGDVERNVMACPAPLADEAHATARRLAREIAVQLRPASGAYHEIWLDGEKQLSTAEEEPFYGETYLPRKFKSGIAPAGDNCIDAYSHDAALITILEGSNLVGYNVVVGGGFGMTHGKADTEARLAEPLGFVRPDQGVETIKTVAAIFRDFGNRADRRHARLKYLLNETGIDWFREEFRRRTTFALHPWRPIPSPEGHDHLGRHPQEGGKWFYGIFVENGRIADKNGRRLRTALRNIVAEHKPGLVLTPQQNLLLTGLDESAIDPIEQTLVEHGVTPATELSAARRYSMACPALPTCSLAIAEAERLMPSVVDRFEEELTSLGLRDEPLTMRMTGCPNGCARPYTADIAFVGRKPDVYHIYVGGGLSGDRLADPYALDVATDDLVDTLHPLLATWAAEREPGESLSDFYQRVYGCIKPRRSITGRETPRGYLVQVSVGL